MADRDVELGEAYFRESLNFEADPTQRQEGSFMLLSRRGEKVVATECEHREPETLEARLWAAVRKVAATGSVPNQVFMNPGDYERLRAALAGRSHTGSVNLAVPAAETGLAVTAAVAGLTWIISRRMALVGNERPSDSWIQEMAAWIVQVIARMFASREQEA